MPRVCFPVGWSSLRTTETSAPRATSLRFRPSIKLTPFTASSKTSIGLHITIIHGDNKGDERIQQARTCFARSAGFRYCALRGGRVDDRSVTSAPAVSVRPIGLGNDRALLAIDGRTRI